jgi:hypothetical protein
MFTSLPAKDELSSKVVGLGVYKNANQTIGTIKDVACSGTSVNSIRDRRRRLPGNGRSLRQDRSPVQISKQLLISFDRLEHVTKSPCLLVGCMQIDPYRMERRHIR